MREPSEKRASPQITLTLGHLYPDQLNLYGDRGNILTLRQRCQWRGIRLRVIELGIGDALDPDAYDMLFIGGGQDREQAPVAQDLYEIKSIGLWAAIEDDMPVLAVCGGYQLLAHYYRPASGPDMKGLGVFDAWTVHRGARAPRCIGDVAITWNGQTLVGFENHGGQTYLGTAQPLGKVLKGHGNNAQDGSEGATYRNAYGTYLHGSLLPKNPHFSDHLIELALKRSYGLSWLAGLGSLSGGIPTQEHSHGSHSSNGTSKPWEEINVLAEGKETPGVIIDPLVKLTPLDDSMEWQAHSALLERLGLHSAANAAWRARSMR
ncbi:MAG: type 1 glutamine amidotransferase [Ktedonobacteraceae bacterium]